LGPKNFAWKNSSLVSEFCRGWSRHPSGSASGETASRRNAAAAAGGPGRSP
jgi:hypothetical protein